MFERYTLSCIYSHHSPLTRPVVIISYSLRLGRKKHITVDIYYSLEDRKGIHTKEINLLDFKEWHDLPNWYPIFHSLIKLTQKLLVRASTSTSKSSTLIRRQIPTFLRHSLTTNQVTSSYETYTMTLTTQTSSAIIEIKTDKSLQFQANWLNIARVTEHHNVT